MGVRHRTGMFDQYDEGALYLRIFFVSWASYIGYYLCRKNFSVLMPFLKSEQGYSSNELAKVLFLYSLAYMLGQFLMGPVVDRFGSRLVVASGMAVSAAMSALTGSVAWLGLAQSANGLAQSSGWPGLLKLTRDWFPQEKRGVTMAWWCTNMVLGGFMATNLAAFSAGSASAAHGGWRRGAWMPSLILAGIAAAFLLLAHDKQSSVVRPAWGAREAPLELKPPLVAIALMYFCIKLVRYSFLFWLPLYMTEALRYSPVRAGYASSIYELGGLAGVLFAGYVSEHVWKKSRFAVGAGMMAALACVCVLFPVLSRTGVVMNLAAIALAGVFTFGPDTLMVGAGVQDVAAQQSTATAAGFVNGVGSLGQLASPFLVSHLSTVFGWDTLFAVLGIASLAGGLILAAQPRLFRLPCLAA